MLVVCPNPTVDRQVILSAVEPGNVLRASENKAFPAGKAVSAARGSRANGARPEVHVLLPDEGADWYETTLRDEGMNVVSHRYPGVVRETILLYEDSGRVTVINGNGAAVEPERWREFVKAVCDRILPGGWVVCSGSFPPGVTEADVTDFVTRVVRAGGRLALDTGPTWLAAGIAGRPALISPNLAEAEAVLSGADTPEPVEPGADALRRAELAAVKLQSRGVSHVTVTAGAAGVAWATPDGTGKLPGIEVEDIGTTGKTLPDFPKMWADMLGGQTDQLVELDRILQHALVEDLRGQGLDDELLIVDAAEVAAAELLSLAHELQGLLGVHVVTALLPHPAGED